MIIPGFLISVVTFPGVIVHEFAHKLFCDLTGTKVYEVCYFRLGRPAGYVRHGEPSNVWEHILIGIGPFFVNTAAGFAIGVVATRPAFGKGGNEIVGMALTWLAVSVAMHSFPSLGDAGGIWRAVWRRRSPILAKLLGTPLVGVICLGSLGSIFWLDLIYGYAVAVVAVKAILG